jgi:hypothetical protein
MNWMRFGLKKNSFNKMTLNIDSSKIIQILQLNRLSNRLTSIKIVYSNEKEYILFFLTGPLKKYTQLMFGEIEKVIVKNNFNL